MKGFFLLLILALCLPGAETNASQAKYGCLESLVHTRPFRIEVEPESSWLGRVVSQSSAYIPPFAPLNRLYQRAVAQPERQNVFRRALQGLGVRLHVNRKPGADIPSEGPVIFIANHLSWADGLFMGAIAMEGRTDFRLVLTDVLERIPFLQEHIVGLEIFKNNEDSRKKNQRSHKEMISWLKDEGAALGIFPAGSTSKRRYHKSNWRRAFLPQTSYEDPAWKPSLARLIKKSEATVVPLFIHGQSSLAFQTIGQMNQSIRNFLHPYQVTRLQGQTVQVDMGEPIPFSQLPENHEDITTYLRERVYQLSPS